VVVNSWDDCCLIVVVASDDVVVVVVEDDYVESVRDGVVVEWSSLETSHCCCCSFVDASIVDVNEGVDSCLIVSSCDLLLFRVVVKKCILGGVVAR